MTELTIAQVAARVGMSRQRLHRYRAGTVTAAPPFPKPIRKVGVSLLYSAADVDAWNHERRSRRRTKETTRS